jgi:hypothetical protein
LAATAPSNPRDPRFRPFRIAAYGLYLVVVCVFSALIIFSVVRSVVSMTPGRPPDAAMPLSERECLQGVELLWRRLEAERQGFSREQDARKVDDRWTRFRVEWLTELRQLEANCGTRSRNREALAEVFERLEKVQDLYTTQSVQYSGESGPAIDKLREALSAARSKK